MQLYFTSNQSSTREELGIERPHEMLIDLGMRLRTAMGEKDILPLNHTIGGEFRVPNFKSYAARLDRSPWTAYAANHSTMYVVPYNIIYDGWENNRNQRRGFMACAANSSEYAYGRWDGDDLYHPDLFDTATFGAWLELLPQPASVIFEGSMATIAWSPEEPRVHRANEMGRYSLPRAECRVTADCVSWRVSRAMAFVRAWEKMAANEPADRYEAVMRRERAHFEERRNR